MNRIIIIALIGAFFAMLAPDASAHTRRHYRRAVAREVVYTGRAVGYHRPYYGSGYYGYAPYGYGYGYPDGYGYGYPYGYAGVGLPFVAFGFGGHHRQFSHGHHFGGHHH